jgi:predicted ArsR family transcriptional regulator
MTPTTAELHQWVQELRQPAELSDGETAAEMAERLGKCRTKVANTIKRLIRAGMVEVGKAKRPAIDGRLVTYTVFRIKEQPHAAGERRRAKQVKASACR